MESEKTMTNQSTTLTLPVQGMTCASCVAHVEKALRGVPGVSKADVNLASESATITRDPSLATTELLASAVDAAGYTLVTSREETAETDPQKKKHLKPIS
jgi:Cu+-exporting ATPase